VIFRATVKMRFAAHMEDHKRLGGGLILLGRQTSKFQPAPGALSYIEQVTLNSAAKM